MYQAEGVPENNVGVVDVCVRIGGDPGGEAHARFAGGLRYVAPRGVNLGVRVWDRS
jgi:hypothetical protein